MTHKEYNDLCKKVRTAAIENGFSNICIFMSNSPEFEKKSERVQLLMQPSILKKAKREANKRHISFNEFVHRAVVMALETNEEGDE